MPDRSKAPPVAWMLDQPARTAPRPPSAPVRATPLAIPAVLCNRRLSLVGFAALPLVDALGGEARLWRQEADLYRRRSGEALFSPSSGATIQPSSGRIDAEFASALLAALRKAAGRDTAAFDAECALLRAQELPFFKEAGTCGHCGTKSGPAALADKDYFDFECYIRSKALLKLCGPTAAPAAAAAAAPDAPPVSEPILAMYAAVDRSACISNLRVAVGDAILKHILDEVDVGDAEAAGLSPMRPTASDALLSASPELDSIRGGVRALLRYFRKKGENAAFFRNKIK